MNAISTISVSAESVKDSSVLNFSNEVFGNIRVIEMNDNIWFVATDIAKILEYRDASNMTRMLDDDEKGTYKASTLGGNQNVTIISESGLYHAVISSKKPEVKVFRKWITSEVLPSIRKNGKYEISANSKSDKELDILDRNSRVEAAKFLERLAEKYEGKSNTFKNVCYVEAANIVSGHKLLNGTETESNGNYLSAKEIAEKITERMGVKTSSQKIGSLAKINDMKTSKYGEWRRTKSEYSNKEVDNFYYKPEAVDKFVELLSK